MYVLEIAVFVFAFASQLTYCCLNDLIIIIITMIMGRERKHFRVEC